MKMEDKVYDVVIIGAGICGSCIARELSKLDIKTALLDKENDVSSGSSKANSGIVHAGYDPVPGTLMARLNIQGAELMKHYSSLLDFSYKEIGSLVLSFDEGGNAKLQELYERGVKNGVKKLSILSRDEVLALEPNVSENVVAALYAPTAAIISPYQTTWAFAESAVLNGVDFFRNTMVHSIKKAGADEDGKGNCNGFARNVDKRGELNDGESDAECSSGLFYLETSSGVLKSRFVVNAGGLEAGKISRMAGARNYSILQRKGEYSLLDSSVSSLVNHVLFQTPTALGKGVLVTKTVDDNILIGPSAADLRDKAGNASVNFSSGGAEKSAVSLERPFETEEEPLYSTGTTAAMQSLIMEKARLSVSDIPSRALINSFAGIRAIALDEKGNEIKDFIIEEDSAVRGFVNVGGICSPGLTSAPAIALMVRDILEKAGLKAKEKSGFIEERKGIKSFKDASLEEREAMIKDDSRFARIICRCEMITEGEIVRAIHSPVGARDLDGVKRRCRAGMGRCQGGFCSPRVTEILSRELQIPMVNVTKKGGVSYILNSKTRPGVPDIAGEKQ